MRAAVHRNVKPSKLFFVNSTEPSSLGRTKVLPSGIADLFKRHGGQRRRDPSSGRLLYIAPEQLLGKRDIDARADIFSLGCVLFECLTGRPPFWSEYPMGIVAKMLLEDAPLVREFRRRSR